jgi:hypothetical protein
LAVAVDDAPVAELRTVKFVFDVTEATRNVPLNPDVVAFVIVIFSPVINVRVAAVV